MEESRTIILTVNKVSFLLKWKSTISGCYMCNKVNKGIYNYDVKQVGLSRKNSLKNKKRAS